MRVRIERSRYNRVFEFEYMIRNQRGLPKHAARCGVSVIAKQEKVEVSKSVLWCHDKSPYKCISEGRIWTMVAGGGASVIYADMNKCRPYRFFRSCISRTQSINDPETILDVYLVGGFDDSPSKV